MQTKGSGKEKLRASSVAAAASPMLVTTTAPIEVSVAE